MDFISELEELKDLLEVSGGKPYSKRERETIYSSAFGKYATGDYEEAADSFTHLILHDPYDSRFWKGLAASRQMQRKYQAALHAWAAFALVSGHSPEGHFHAAECYLSMGEIKEAEKALKLAEKHVKHTDPMAQKVHSLQEQLYG